MSHSFKNTYRPVLITHSDAGQECQDFIAMARIKFVRRGYKVRVIDLKKDPKGVLDVPGVDAVPTIALLPNTKGHHRNLKTGTCPDWMLEQWLDKTMPDQSIRP